MIVQKSLVLTASLCIWMFAKHIPAFAMAQLLLAVVMVWVPRILLLISLWQFSKTCHLNSLKTASRLVLLTMLLICHYLLKNQSIQPLKVRLPHASGALVPTVQLVPTKIQLRLSVIILICTHRLTSHMTPKNPVVLQFPIFVSVKTRFVQHIWSTRLTSWPATTSHMFITMICSQHLSQAASSF